jgi:NADH-quinone oxidoreductase subunit N
MAYSSIGHMGFAMVGLVPGTEQGVYGVLIYMAIYLAMTLGAFAVLLSMRIGDRYVENIADLAGLSRTRGVLAFFLAMLMLSLAGIPPLAGFFAKLYVFQPAINAGFYWLAVIGVLLSVVSTFYYLRIVKVIYFDQPAETFDAPHREVTGVLWVASLVVLLFWIYPAPVLDAASNAARSLF